MKAANTGQTDDLINRTRAVWQPRIGRDLSRDEAQQIDANMTGFFSILAEWARQEEQEAQHQEVPARQIENDVENAR